MSADSFALLRKGLQKDLAGLAEEHYKHDLQQSDRDTLTSAARTVSTSTTVGSLIGLTLSLFLAHRIRRNRLAMFNAIKTAERPTHIQFASGRSEPLPDMTPYLKPSTLGDVATYTFFAGGGLFLGGELGLLGGGLAARRSIAKDGESRKRIEGAFRNFRVDVLKAEARLLEEGKGDLGL
ncbi:hypothetical protein CAC42_2040 [Sphaceloma murrayae]|uniref:Uncharacterized protein n=1 Tax=Sphaceloma murrayae TaxID=2082308 RepID=A0A2K1QIN0_9PEZI|nr:hypothetical protein CAC42_2040 [Sphaceloma murrayae]